MSEGDEPPQFDWGAFVPRLVHPLKVAIIEAMLWIEMPLSPSELDRLFYYGDVPQVSYHAKKLAEAGAIKKVGERPVRGRRQTLYFFPGQKWKKSVRTLNLA